MGIVPESPGHALSGVTDRTHRGFHGNEVWPLEESSYVCFLLKVICRGPCAWNSLYMGQLESPEPLLSEKVYLATAQIPIK